MTEFLLGAFVGGIIVIVYQNWAKSQIAKGNIPKDVVIDSINKTKEQILKFFTDRKNDKSN